VLEHVRDPGRLLEDCRAHLAPGGRLIASLPNVANIHVRLQLLGGRFEYTPRGILDATHLRFYTRDSGRELLERHGYRVTQQRATIIPIDLVLGRSARGPGMRLLARVLNRMTAMFPTLLGYQNVYVAHGSYGSEQTNRTAQPKS
jgi:hypothetical protein